MTTSWKSLVSLATAFALLLLAVPGGAFAAKPAPGKTLDNLMTAFNGESNAHARYLAFAEKADEEGYGKAASLFRAAARAEEIHAGNHAKVIEAMGGTAKATIEAPEVKTTAENLEAAIAGETYERDTMYPGFLAAARAERNADAVETFNYAKTAEAEHAKLYQNALDNLAGMTGDGETYYVCSVCGFTTTRVDFSKCPSCFSPKEKYETVG